MRKGSILFCSVLSAHTLGEETMTSLEDKDKSDRVRNNRAS